MRYVHEKGSISNREYRALTNVSESTGMRDLDILVSRGALRAVGQKRARRYLLA
jgi:predicted HTH transcriptional regulator